ncbi:MAG: hypothetical protein PF795_00715 [Kiritimatiellae bacterium]|jgi:hypothetical protein|nr:hypothetical protein [Kiritimatiellia bacterium]
MNEALMKKEIADRVAARVTLRGVEIGVCADHPSRVYAEVKGLGWLVQRIEDDLSLEEWSAESLAAMVDSSVDLAAASTRLAEALESLRLRRVAVNGGSCCALHGGGDPFEGFDPEGETCLARTAEAS